MTIATSIFLIAAGAILRYAVNFDSSIISIPTVGLILMIAGGAGLALSLLYELIQNPKPQARPRDEHAPSGDPYEDRTRRLR